jgi:hypothetical protein
MNQRRGITLLILIPNLNFLIGLIISSIKLFRAGLHAFLMGMHPEIGQESGIRTLPVELLDKIFSHFLSMPLFLPFSSTENIIFLLLTCTLLELKKYIFT